MGFETLVGQDTAVQTLLRALETGRVHHAYRFEGPAGVGKEMAAFALAQALVCSADGPLACGTCSACHRAVTLADADPAVPLHPDVVLVQRGLYASAGVSASEATGVSVEQIRKVVLARAGYSSHEGRALVFIVRDADELTVGAANALLKVLEEPGQGTHFVLVTSRPNRLLDTIRSRTLAVRFGPLPERVVADILEQHGASREVASLAQGSASLALELAEDESMRSRQAFIDATLAALEAPDLATAMDATDTKGADRNALRDQLSFLAQHLARVGRQHVEEDPIAAERAARRYELVRRAMTELERNGQPALVFESMLSRLRRA